MIRTFGQRRRIRAVMRWTSSSAPSDPSMSDLRSRAVSRKSSQKMYSGR
jgi:hypothetical protein